LFSELLPVHAARDVGPWPALQTLLARGDREPAEPMTVEESLCRAFGVTPSGDGSPPVADITAAVDLACPAPPRGLIRADPVYLRADPADLVLFDVRSFELSEDEADALLVVLNSGLQEHGLTLSRGRVHTRWYAAIECGDDLRSFSPLSISGRPVDRHLPFGGAAPVLRRVMNDAQMLLHASDINADRLARGLPPINSIWFWGAGELPEPKRARPDLVVADDILCAGLAKRYDSVWLERADDISEVLDGLASAQTALVVIGAPTGSTGEPVATTLDEFEAQWCGPLLAALKRKRLKRLRIITDRGNFVMTRGSLRRFWRGVKTLHAARDALPGRTANRDA
jgi:hypothetical protein